jgi:cell pole-organizing protein PopZ
MSEQAAPEPTMEEILASIRRIISEDDGAPSDIDIPRGEEPELAVSNEALPPVPEEPLGEDVLELTDRVDAPPAETVGDIAAYVPPEPPPPAPPAAAPPKPEDVLVGEPAAMAAASAFGQLSAAITMPEPGRTLEDVVRELLRPLLKDWLDSNLPRIVEAKVAEEVERISRTRLR